MDKEVAILLLVCALILGGLFFVGYKRTKNLKDSGKIIDRRHNFMEYAEYFTLRDLTPQEYLAALKQWGLTECGRGNTGELKLRGSDFEAELLWLDSPEKVSKFCFRFLSWKTRDGMSTSLLEQNMLLTKTEKMFLSLDPAVQVSYQKLDTN